MTTEEMDGLFTPKDIERQHSAFIQCRQCSKWSPTDTRNKDKKCVNCESTDLDTQSLTSERSFNPFNKRKIKK